MRKEEIITINDRGNELTFRIREMPATRLERWLILVGKALASTGFAKDVDIADGMDTTKVIADILMKDGLRCLGNLDYDKTVKPLLDELYTCVEQKVGEAYLAVTADNIDSKVEDIRSLFAIQKAVITLHLGFFGIGGASGSAKSPSPEASRGAQTANCSPLFAPLIINHYATLYELQTVYDYEDALMMLECMQVDSYNQWALQQAAEREAGHGNR